MPNQPKTKARSVRVPEDLWQAAKERAKERGETVTDLVVRGLLTEVVGFAVLEERIARLLWQHDTSPAMHTSPIPGSYLTEAAVFLQATHRGWRA